MALGLEAPLLRHADNSRAGYEPVIQNSDIDPLQDTDQALRDELVSVAKVAYLTGVVMPHPPDRQCFFRASVCR